MILGGRRKDARCGRSEAAAGQRAQKARRDVVAEQKELLPYRAKDKLHYEADPDLRAWKAVGI